ncbi:MAG: lipopolysaccharide heptosyltransferase II [Desulfobulbaceae bacterium]|nr:lipopolysaccharide heptosyltransferase II [Desulfobulbaceae bacterium]
MKKSLREFQPRKILVRSTNWIGDAIMTTPAVRTIRENFPTAEITLLAQPWVADVFAAGPHVDKIIHYHKKTNHKGISGMLRLSRDLRKEHFDMAILLQNAFEAALIAKMAGIPVRAGYKRDGRSLLLTHGVKIRDEIRKKHQVYYYQALMRDLGLTPGADELFLQLSDEDMAFARKLKHDLTPGPVLGINPGAAFGPAKCWPSERYGELAALLHKEKGVQALVFGTAADQQTIETITGSGPDFIHGLAGKTTLAQAMALISVCDAFVTNDSGLMHVGAATKTPMVAIFGSTDAVATGPFSEQAMVLEKDLECRPCLKKECPRGFECMLHISVEEVAEEVRKILD